MCKSFLSLTRARALRVTLCLVAVFAFARAAAAEPFETIVNHGDASNRVDVVFLGDGYTADEMSKFQADVQKFMQGMFEEEPFREYQRYFNVHRVDVTSVDSGVDHPERGVLRNTAFDATYNCNSIQRLVCANLGKVSTVLTNTLAPAQRDLVILIVNDAEYGGSGGSIAIASTHPVALGTVLHETGHTLGLLADEYSSSPPTCENTVEPPQVNVTRETSRAAIKWNVWIDPSTPVPTTGTTQPALPGLYVGARYCTTGLYRPTYSSKMRDSSRPYEQVNSEQLVRRIYNRVSPVDSVSPAGTTLQLTTAQSQTFTVTTPSPMTHALTVSWTVDGQPAGSSASLNVAAGALPAGTHTVEATVRDETSYVRSDPQELLTERVAWSINVTSANQIDDTGFFVAQHYRDFLGREPDADGLAFWVGDIQKCGVDAACREIKRVHVSAAFFLSIEFQETGYFAYRVFQVAYGDRTESSTGLSVPNMTREEFSQETPLLNAGVIVGVGDWRTKLDQNKAAYVNGFVERQRFKDLYAAQGPAQYVARLNANAGGALSPAQEAALATQLSASDTAAARADVLFQIAASDALDLREKNRAFVLMQYFGYLRRNPSDAPEAGLNYAGWKFWLDKLNQFDGDFVRAEMVKAFLDSTEYRKRFGQ
jgi:hypothetical protein